MGNILRCFEGQEDHQGPVVHGGGSHYPYYQPQYYGHGPPAAAPRPHQQALGPHGDTPVTASGATALKQALIRISGGDITKVPPDYREFLALLGNDNLTMRDEFLIVNHAALLPMKNRTEVFLMLHNIIVKYLGRTNRAKKRRILSKLPYENDWLDTARANAQINKWVVKCQNEYRRTQLDLLRLNRNVRSHLHEYNDDNIEEILYCEWPELLMDMVKLLHLEGELEDTDIQNKFG